MSGCFLSVILSEVAAATGLVAQDDRP